MDNLKIFINEKENPVKIDDEITKLYKLIGMEINPKKTGIATHKGIVIPNELDKYEKIRNENKQKYLGLYIFEVNENKINEAMIIEKVKAQT